jgi:hypothetical protein
MGRWATVRRRSSSAVSAAPLGPPPAPSLDVVENFLIQTNSGLPNNGGTITLYTSPDGLAPWTVEYSVAWELVRDWGPIAGLPELFLAADSIGNGIAYSGPSEKSNVYDNTPV